MPYIGNPIITTDYPVDTFSGNGSTTAFTLSLAPASVNSILVAVSGVIQDPSTYSVSSTTLTFTAAPPSGTGNISVRHLGVAGIPNTPSAASVQYSSLNSSLQGTLVGKNRIINGAMMIDQRNAGASVNPTDNQYCIDRWVLFTSQASKYTAQQNAGSVTPPAGFTNYLGITSSSAYSLTSSDYFVVEQKIEGLNVADLSWGSSNAKTVTISFWVRSSLTGVFGGVLKNNGNNRSYPFSYTISSANTWEQKSVTIPGDTTGTWLTTNGTGIRFQFSLGVGSNISGTAGAWANTGLSSVTGATSVVGTNGATFYITGVQLEVGSTATSFDYRPYTTELQLCQRYFCKNSNVDVVAANGHAYTDAGKFSSGTLNAYASGAAYVDWIQFPVTMRAIPTVTFFRTNLGGTLDGAWTIYDTGATLWESPSSQNVQSSSTTGFGAAIGGSFPAGATMWYGAWTASIEL